MTIRTPPAQRQRQMPMFPGGEDLPLFTGTPLPAGDHAEFQPTPVPPPQLTLWDMRPTLTAPVQPPGATENNDVRSD